MTKYFLTITAVLILIFSTLPVLKAAKERELSHGVVTFLSQEIEQKVMIDRAEQAKVDSKKITLQTNTNKDTSERDPSMDETSTSTTKSDVEKTEQPSQKTVEVVVKKVSKDVNNGGQTSVRKNEYEVTVAGATSIETEKPNAPEPKSIASVEREEGTPFFETKTETDTKIDSYLEAVQLEIHRLTNIQRKKAGIPQLEMDLALATIATEHSKDMAKLDYFAHNSLDGCDPGCRFRAGTYLALMWGENLGWITFFEETEPEELAAEFMDSWMDSDDHRHNVLNEGFTHEGIGLAMVNEKIFVTVDFTDPW